MIFLQKRGYLLKIYKTVVITQFTYVLFIGQCTHCLLLDMEILLLSLMVFIQFNVLEEMIMACSWVILGGFFFTFTIGKLSSVLSNLNTRESQIKEKRNVIQQFAQQTNIDNKVRDKLITAVIYVTKKNFLWSDKKELFDELPAKLRSDIARTMYNGIVKKIRFFEDRDSNFIGAVVPMLAPLKV